MSRSIRESILLLDFLTKVRNHIAVEHKTYFVYILASKFNGTIYIGATNNLVRRLEEHQKGEICDFTARYKAFNLVYFEKYNDIRDALTREKRLKNWRRQWKIDLINQKNPKWIDLRYEI